MEKKNGKGIAYNTNGEILFEGEFLNGRRWNGKGKEYDIFGLLSFEGTYLNGKKKNN